MMNCPRMLVTRTGSTRSTGSTGESAGTDGLRPDRQRVAEHVVRVVRALDRLEPGVVVLEVQTRPGDARGVQGRVGEVRVRVVDVRAVAARVRGRHAAGGGVQVLVEGADPGDVLVVLARVGPVGGQVA